MDANERRLLAATCYGHFLSHFNMLTFPAIVMPLTGRLGLSLADVLELSIYQYLFFGISALPWGLLADRRGPKMLMLIFFFGAGISGLAAAFFTDSPLELTISLACLGLFTGIYHPVGLGLISKNVKRLSMGMAYNGMFGNLGLASAPLVTGLVNHIWGIEGAFLVLAALNFTGLFLIPFISPGESEATGKKPIGANQALTPFLILLIAMMLGGLAYRGATVILPAYFEIKGAGIQSLLSSITGKHLTPNLVATSLASLIYLLGMIGQFTGGWVGERREVRYSYLLFHILTLPAVLAISLTGNMPLLFSAIIYFFFLLGMQPLENTLVAALTPPGFHHSAYGAKFVLTFGIGALAVGMVGAIESNWGIGWVFPALGVISVMLVLCILLLIIKTTPIGGRS